MGLEDHLRQAEADLALAAGSVGRSVEEAGHVDAAALRYARDVIKATGDYISSIRRGTGGHPVPSAPPRSSDR